MNTQLPPPIPPPIYPAPVPTAPPAPRIWVAGFATASVLLLLVNVVISVVLASTKRVAGSPAVQSGYLLGYVGGGILIPSALVLGIASIWKANRRFYPLLKCFFWTMLALIAARALPLLSLITARQTH